MIGLAALAVVPAQSSEPFIIGANNENYKAQILYPPDEIITERELPKLPVAQDIPKNIGGTGLSYYTNLSIVPKWENVGRPINGDINFSQNFSISHNGIDILGFYGQEILAVQDGIVKKVCSGYCGGYGNMVLIQHNSDFSTLYAHLSKINIKQGQKVIKHQILGFMGNTGRVRPLPTKENPYQGTHLHFCIIYREIEFVNPLRYIL